MLSDKAKKIDSLIDQIIAMTPAPGDWAEMTTGLSEQDANHLHYRMNWTAMQLLRFSQYVDKSPDGHAAANKAQNNTAKRVSRHLGYGYYCDINVNPPTND